MPGCNSGRMPGRLFLLAALGIAAASSAALGQKIGVTTAVTLTTTGQPPGLEERQLTIGTDMVANEQVVTTSTGRAHLLFLDRSSLIVAPDSNLVLDEYVFDPKTKTGKVVFTTTKGFFRYVGGALSKNKNAVEFRTPLATVGLRGGIADVEVAGSKGGKPKQVSATKLFGTEVRITPCASAGQNADAIQIKRNGFKGSVGVCNGPVSLSRVPASEMLRNLKRVEGEKGLPPVTAPAAGGSQQSATAQGQNTSTGGAQTGGGQTGSAQTDDAQTDDAQADDAQADDAQADDAQAGDAQAGDAQTESGQTQTAQTGAGEASGTVQTAVVPNESTNVVDSGALQPPTAIAPAPSGLNLVFTAATVTGSGTATGSVDSQANITGQAQDAANQQVLANNLINSILRGMSLSMLK